MGRTKQIAAVISLVLAVTLAASCGAAEIAEETPPAVETESPAETDTAEDGTAEERTGIDFDTAYGAYAPDTVMITVGDYDVRWDELFFYFCNNIAYLQSQTSGEIEFAAEMSDGMTYGSRILSNSTDDALSYCALTYGAGLMGITITDEDKEQMQKDYETASAELGGEDVLLQRLRENSYIYNKELFMYLYGLEYLTSLSLDEMFGAECEKVTDEMVAEQLEAGSFLTVKHILRKFPDDSADTEGRDAAHKEAQDILDRLNSYDGEDFDAYFDEIMFSESDDSGALASFPDGYLFREGDMVQEFYDACVELEEGEVSDLVETTYGYHIIYKLPVNYDITPISSVNEGVTTSLRQQCASYMFNSKIYDWMEELEPSYSAEYNELDLAAIFKEYA